MTKATFKLLHIGAVFTFTNEAGVDGLQWQGARGPWCKVGSTTYRAVESGYAHGPTHRVGTVKVQVEQRTMSDV